MFLISWVSKTRCRFHFDFGILDQLYGPAKGGFVFVRRTCAGPISVFFTVVISPNPNISFSNGNFVGLTLAKNFFFKYLFLMQIYKDYVQQSVSLFLCANETQFKKHIHYDRIFYVHLNLLWFVISTSLYQIIVLINFL